MLALEGLIWIEASVADVTVKDAAGELTAPRLAEILVPPTASAEASPLEPGALLIAAAPPEDAHVTAEVRFWEEPSV